VLASISGLGNKRQKRDRSPPPANNPAGEGEGEGAAADMGAAGEAPLHARLVDALQFARRDPHLRKSHVVYRFTAKAD
jgi:hypothetical protein